MIIRSGAENSAIILGKLQEIRTLLVQ